ncbi:MAG: family 16 glycosylhydrolase, partial [bacterium]
MAIKKTEKAGLGIALGAMTVFGTAGAGHALASRGSDAKPAALAPRPACGVTGYELAIDYTFGTEGNVRNLADLDRLFTHDAPWGRINEELETFPPFNARNHVFEKDCLALTGLHDGSTNYTEYGHITSGALVSRSTCGAPCIVEWIVKQPAGRGVWPAVWLYDTHSGRHDSSEIDVLESQNNPLHHLDRSMVFQYDHGPGAGDVLEDPGGLGKDGFWRPYGPMPQGDLSARYAAYSVLWLPDRTTRFVDDKRGITRAFRWTGPAPANILVYQSIGSAKLDWPGPVLPQTFTGDNAVFRIRSIRVFKPVR